MRSFGNISLFFILLLLQAVVHGLIGTSKDNSGFRLQRAAIALSSPSKLSAHVGRNSKHDDHSPPKSMTTSSSASQNNGSISATGNGSNYVPTATGDDAFSKAKSKDKIEAKNMIIEGAHNIYDDKEDAGGAYYSKLPTIDDDEADPPSEKKTIVDMQTILDSTFVNDAYTNQVPYLLARRSYARSAPFANENLTVPIDLEDLLPETRKIEDTFYFSLPAGLLAFGLTFFAFPHVTDFIVNYMDSNPKDLDEIVSKLVPGITIMYGTYISLTLNILYNRQRFVQDSVAQETSMLSFCLQNMVSLFRRDRDRMVRSGQAAADQVQILLKETRGQEYMTVVYADPYTKLLHLVEEEEERLVREHGDFLSKGPNLSTCRDTIRDLRKYRSIRLSDESLGLPETHFNLLSMMTFLILMGYVVSVLPAVEDLGYTPIESRFLFSILSVVYLLFYCVARDLNDLYRGVFQLRKGSAACHLLEIKKIVADHPWLRKGVDFERVNQEVMCFAPEMNECWLE